MVLKRCLTGVLVKHSLNKTKILSGTLSLISLLLIRNTSDAPNIEGNKVEFVPLFNIKTGTGIGYKNFFDKCFMYHQYTEANNSITDKMTILMEFLRFHRTMLQIFSSYKKMEARSWCN
jgi:hypothetical protein